MKVQGFIFQFINSNRQNIICCMGINESSQGWTSQFQQIYHQNEGNIRKIKHRRTQQKYQLLSLYAFDVQQQSTLISRLAKRQNIKSKYLQQVHSHQYVKQQNYCGDKKRYDIIFKQSSPTLENHFNYRKIKNQRFSNGEILYVIKNIALALKDFRDMGENYGDVRFCNILVSDGVKLKDTILMKEDNHNFQNITAINRKRNRIKGFPSPQKLYTYFDSLTHFEQFTADLFSLGIVALQLYFLNQNMNNLYILPNLSYQNARINLNQLYSFIELVTDREIKQNICILTSQIANQRVQIYSRISQMKIDQNKIKILKINPFAIYEQENQQHVTSINQQQVAKANNFSNFSIKNQKKYVQTPNLIFHTNQVVNPRFIQSPIKTKFQSSNIHFNHSQESLQTNNFLQNSLSLHKIPSYNEPYQTKAQIKFNTNQKSLSTISTDIYYYKSNENKCSSLSTPSSSYLIKPFTMPSFIQNLTPYSSNVNIQSSPTKQLKFPEIFNKKNMTENSNIIPTNIPPSLGKQQKAQTLVLGRESIKNEYVYNDAFKDRLSNEPVQKVTLISILDQNLQKHNGTQSQIQNAAMIKEAIEQDSSKGDNNEIVIEQYQIGTRYEGQKKDGMRNGYGKILYTDGSYYIGQWKENKMDGFGTLYYPTGKKAYQGDWKEDQFHGKGVVYNDHPVSRDTPFDYINFNKIDEEWVKYEGELRNDAKEGIGRLTLTNGQVYEGQFCQDFIHGEGAFTKMNGSVIRGFWSESLLSIEKI